MQRYLIVANLTLAGDALWEEVQQRLAGGPSHFHVLVPASHDVLGGTWTEDEARQEAAGRLSRALQELERLGADADGEVGDLRTIDSTLDALRTQDYDEIILSTLPPNLSRWLRLDLLSRLQRLVDVPVVHVTGEAEHVS